MSGSTRSLCANEGVSAFAMFAIGGGRFVIGVNEVVRVLPIDSSWLQMPLQSGRKARLLPYQDRVLPLVNLDAALAGHESANAVNTKALVMRSGDRMIAVEVEEVCGLVRAGSGSLQKIVHQDDSPDLVRHVLRVDDGHEGVVSVLDVPSLLRQCGLWSDHAGASGVTQSYRLAAAKTQPYVVFRSGATCLGVPILDCRRIVASSQLQASGGSANFWGILQMDGCEWHVANVQSVMGAPRQPERQGNTGYLTVSVDGRNLAFPVAELLQVCRFPLSGVQEDAVSGMRHGHLFSAMATLGDGQRIYLINSRAWMDHCAISSRPTQQGGAPVAAQGDAERMLVFQARHAWATPMRLLHGIAPLPGGFIPNRVPGSEIVGSHEWRGRIISVLDFDGLCDGDEVLSDHSLLIVGIGSRLGAVLARSVDSLVNHGAGRLMTMNMAGQYVNMVSYSDDRGGKRSLRITEFADLPFFGQAVARTASPVGLCLPATEAAQSVE